MPRLYSSAHIVKILQRAGFSCVSQKGSHAKFKKGAKRALVVIVPVGKKEIPMGTFKSILRQAHLAEEDFKKKK